MSQHHTDAAPAKAPRRTVSADGSMSKRQVRERQGLEVGDDVHVDLEPLP